MRNKMGYLSAYHKPVANPLFSMLDHTYVVASDGTKWRCNGADSGGEQIIEKSTDIEIAHSIAGANGMAGIHYGVTGVCHQISNRILYPSDTTVKMVAGYFLSVATYGEYGVGEDNWKELKISSNEQFSMAGNSETISLLDSLSSHRHDLIRENSNSMTPFYTHDGNTYKQNEKKELKLIAKSWRLMAVDNAIDFTEKNMSLFEYVKSINDGATKFVIDVAGVILPQKAQTLMGMPVTESSKFELISLDEMKKSKL